MTLGTMTLAVLLGTIPACILLVATIMRGPVMNTKLQAAIDALVTETADTKTKLDSIKTFIQGVPALVGAAVTDALAQANVDEETAATVVEGATQTVSDAVDDAVAAISTGTEPTDTGEATA